MTAPAPSMPPPSALREWAERRARDAEEWAEAVAAEAEEWITERTSHGN